MSEPPQIKDILDNGVAEPYDPALFDYDEVATGVDGLDAVGDDELAEFHERKFLLVRNVFAREQIDRACDAMHDLIFKRGKGSYNIHFEPGVKDKIDQLQDTEREHAVRKLADFNDVDPRLDALLYDPGVLATLVKLGVDDPQMFQTMALIKPPGGRDKAWHQDRAYFNVPIEDPIDFFLVPDVDVMVVERLQLLAETRQVRLNSCLGLAFRRRGKVGRRVGWVEEISEAEARRKS